MNLFLKGEREREIFLRELRAAPRRIVSASIGRTRILCKPLEEMTFIAVIHGELGFAVIAHSIYVSLSPSIATLASEEWSITFERNK